jgi:hypothetical protein
MTDNTMAKSKRQTNTGPENATTNITNKNKINLYNYTEAVVFVIIW